MEKEIFFISSRIRNYRATIARNLTLCISSYRRLAVLTKYVSGEVQCIFIFSPVNIIMNHQGGCGKLGEFFEVENSPSLDGLPGGCFHRR